MTEHRDDLARAYALPRGTKAEREHRRRVIKSVKEIQRRPAEADAPPAPANTDLAERLGMVRAENDLLRKEADHWRGRVAVLEDERDMLRAALGDTAPPAPAPSTDPNDAPAG